VAQGVARAEPARVLLHLRGGDAWGVLRYRPSTSPRPSRS
jgi:hypothetical protein